MNFYQAFNWDEAKEYKNKMDWQSDQAYTIFEMIVKQFLPKTFEIALNNIKS